MGFKSGTFLSSSWHIMDTEKSKKKNAFTVLICNLWIKMGWDLLVLQNKYQRSFEWGFGSNLSIMNFSSGKFHQKLPQSLSKGSSMKGKCSNLEITFLFKVEVLFILLLWINKRLLLRGPSHFGCHRCKSHPKSKKDIEIQKQKRSFIINFSYLLKLDIEIGHLWKTFTNCCRWHSCKKLSF
jgi:hypothetical protein